MSTSKTNGMSGQRQTATSSLQIQDSHKSARQLKTRATRLIKAAAVLTHMHRACEAIP